MMELCRRCSDLECVSECVLVPVCNLCAYMCTDLVFFCFTFLFSLCAHSVFIFLLYIFLMKCAILTYI